jgi:osmoprotectant transport system substrate-binding protein
VARRCPIAWVAAFAVLGASIPACGGDADQAGPGASALEDGAVTVGSFDFPESELLAELYSQALEASGADVERAFRLGPRELLAPAMAAGLIEMIPEYAGTALQFLSLGESSPTSAVGPTRQALIRALGDAPIVALAAAPAQNANALVVTRRTAERLDLDEISDLADAAPSLTFGGPPECPTRRFCLAGLEDVYGLHFRPFVALDVGGPLTREALERGDIDVALMFTTDPTTDDFVVLRDDRHLQPAENVVPLVREEVVERWGDELVEAIDEVSTHLTTDALRAMNGAVAAGRSPADVAAEWLDVEVRR